jgi:hypothetical protein
MFALLVIIAFALCLPELAPVFGQTRLNLEGEASGTVSVSDGVNTRSIRMKYAYASSSSSPDFYFTDTPLPEDPWLWHQYIEVMARDGKLNALHAYSLEHDKTKMRADTQDVDIELYCSACECKDDLGFWKVIGGDGELDQRIVDQMIVGKLRADFFQEDCPGGKQLQIEKYDVAFKTKPAPVMVGGVVSDGEDKPGIAYSQFYKAVMDEDAKAIRRLVASEHASLFEGTNAQKNVARLKSLIKPFTRAWSTTFYMGDRYAGLDLEEEQPGTEPRPKQIFKTKWYSSTKPNAVAPPLPPPPPPPPAARPTVVTVPRAKGKANIKGNASPKPPVFAVAVNSAKALMVLERGEWKIDWWMFFDADGYNLLSSVETYRTRAEAEKEREEKYWRIADTKPMPAVGGDAGKAYLAFCQSERAGNKIAMLKYLTGEQHDVYAQPELTIKRGATIWKAGNALEYANIEVVSGEAGSGRGLLQVKAVRRGKRVTGRVMMILEESRWKVDREDWRAED